MNNTQYILFALLSFIAGIVLGLIFFGGLWVTVRRALQSKMPGLWFAGGLISRVTITVTGFYFISQGSWQKLLICLTGFITARYIVLKATKKTDGQDNKIKKEVLNEA